MIYSINTESQQDIEEYQLKPQKAKVEVPDSICMLSDLDIAYTLAFKVVSINLPCSEILKQTGTFYTFQPDQRPITFRKIGKHSPGPSPPWLFTPVVN